MSRSMTSIVSALSSVVANGHQTVHCVSSTPSKIPYGGFSPVRLQTGCQEQPSPSHSGLIRSHSSYLLRTPYSALFRSRTCVQAVRTASDANTPVQWPLAPQPVVLSGRLLAYYGHIRASASLQAAYELCPLGLALSRQRQRVPNLLCQSLRPCHRPYSGGPNACL